MDVRLISEVYWDTIFPKPSNFFDKQDSINDPHDSLLMYSGAKETSNKSTINDGNRKLRRVVRSLKSAPLLDMSNSVVSENENQTASLHDDPADIREFDIQEKENDFTKRPLPLKRKDLSFHGKWSYNKTKVN